MQSICPLKLDKHKYLFNYLQEKDLCADSLWFTPNCSKKFLKNKSATDLEGVLNVSCRGISNSQVKKYKN